MPLTPLPTKLTRKTLLTLPHRKWDEPTTYDYLYLVPTGHKHSSNFGLISIVGVLYNDEEGQPLAERAAMCDDVCWTTPSRHPYNYAKQGYLSNILRIDAIWPSNILRVWASGEHYFRGRFLVGHSLSSTEVTLQVWPRGTGQNKVTGEVISCPS